MTAIKVDPRTVAEYLEIGTDDLARLLTKWAKEELPEPDYERNWAPMPLDDFDRQVERARRYLVAAHGAQEAWETDNPPDPEEDEPA